MATRAVGEVRVEGPPPGLVAVVAFIDKVSEWTGRLFCWIIVPLMLGTTYEVLARYVFNAPTIWAYDLSYMLYGGHFMLGAGYTLLRGGHIRTDIFYQNWSPRTRATVDALLYLLFFFPGMAFYFWMGTQEAVQSWSIGERSDASPWRPLISPLKTAMPAGALLLIFQGISEFIKSAYLALKGRAL
ncbi:MAG: TRAP transporter small permease subunit [Chloroflexota bacterium]